MTEKIMTIASKAHPYEVYLADSLKESITSLKDARHFFLIDQKVRKLYETEFSEFFTDKNWIEIEANEFEKSYEQIAKLYTRLIEGGFKRTHNLVVIGGGVLQDIGCFIASTLYRGTSWTMLPTTLLAQCDSCVGSKSSLNIGPYKNQLGTFYPPNEIYIVPRVLATLEPRDIASGLGEIIKLALVDSPATFSTRKKQIEEYQRDPSKMRDLIVESLKIKKPFVEEDEFDKGIRQILNYGHTFAHAYEAASDYKIPHGIAVLLGVSSATYFSVQKGMVSEQYYQDLNSYLKKFYQPFDQELKRLAIADLKKAFKSDKKNTSDKVSFVLTSGEGKMTKVALDLEAEAIVYLEKYLASL